MLPGWTKKNYGGDMRDRIRSLLVLAFIILAADAFLSSAYAFSRVICYGDPNPKRSINSEILDCTGDFVFTRPTEDKAAIFYGRGLLYQLDGQNDRAIDDFTHAIGWMSDFADAFEARGDAYDAIGQHDHALEDYAQASKLAQGTPMDLNDRCWMRAVRGYPLDRALADCTESLRQSPDLWHTLDTRCLVYFRMGNYAAAIADCDAAIKQQPHLASSLYVRGAAKLRSGDTAGGNADIETAKSDYSNIADVFALYGVKP
jgi:tetratricopeptide (TPR) repeat protein